MKTGKYQEIWRHQGKIVEDQEIPSASNIFWIFDSVNQICWFAPKIKEISVKTSEKTQENEKN